MDSQEHVAVADELLGRLNELNADRDIATRTVLLQEIHAHALIGVGLSLQEIRVALGQMKPIRI